MKYDKCPYAIRCKYSALNCDQDFVYCKKFSILANEEYQDMKKRKEKMREIELNDIGLVKRIVQDFRVEGVE